jgi:hypothetical protein
MGVADWRAWTAQGGGTMVTAPNPPGTPYIPNSLFPGVGPIIGTPAAPGKGDLIDGTLSIPPYPNVPVTVNAVDPFGGWTDQKAFVLNSTGAQVPVMRPSIPGLTAP